jgi:hypothetical protein
MVDGSLVPRFRNMLVLMQNKLLLFAFALVVEKVAFCRSSSRVAVRQRVLDDRDENHNFCGWDSGMNETSYLLPFDDVRGPEVSVHGTVCDQAIALRHGGGPDLRTADRCQTRGYERERWIALISLRSFAEEAAAAFAAPVVFIQSTSAGNQNGLEIRARLVCSPVPIEESI